MKPVVTLILAVLLCGACQSNEVQRQTYVGTGVDVSSMQRFAWAETKILTMLGPLYGSETSALEGRLKAGAKHALTARGYQYVENAGDAEFVVSFVAGTREQTVENQTSNQNEPPISGISDSLRAGLSVVLKAENNDVLWQGTAIDRINGRVIGGEEGEVALALLEDIMQSLPPSRR
jgi:hypothetical protein